ncbi:GNAT family N-acetyltransferase [Longimicrobium sp.]|uniref:GNAT family N-acetyltransferase n=1 Tax=Longimicrobium sp. TaxID=2029185 RepID=UPI002C55ED91|nr:GNAT family N-acetyltransferase [Longimicrobium sp.]HSU13292.1 GNAT family N-acetyltransferase [Longimicrobium sp.]
MLSELAAKIRRKGFTGPRYVGLGGKLRFLRESTLARRELVFAATPESFAAAPAPQGPPLELHRIRAAAGLEPFRAGLAAAWYPGLVESFAPPLGWGEEAVIGTVDGEVACYCWMQFGTAEGFPTYYGRMLEREARILRAGVAPAFRRSGLNKLTMHRLLERSFAAGAERVWAECYLHNLPAARTFLRIGFRAVGVLTVLEAPPLRGFVRWSSLDPAAALYRRHGVDLLAAPSPASPSPVAAAEPAGVA